MTAASMEAKIPHAPRSVMCEVSLSPLPKYLSLPGDVPDDETLYGHKSPSLRTSARLERKRGDDIHEIFICEYCKHEFSTRTLLQRHLNVCVKYPGNRKARQFKIPDCPPSDSVKQIHVDHLARARKIDLAERLGLLPLSKAKVVRKQRSRVREIQITKLDDSENGTAIKSPTTPRAKSLISQLSREFSPPAAKARRKGLFGSFDGDGGHGNTDVSDAESISSKTSDKAGDNDQPKDTWNKEKRSSILSIDFSSPLGIRAGKLMNQQAEKMLQYAEETTTNYEEFCRTPKKADLNRRLRDRKDVITFKKNRRVCPRWAHSYKFTLAERVEWYRTIRSGLNARSRPLRKLLKKCSVKLVRLEKDVIKKWTTPKPRPYPFNQDILTPHQMQNLLQQHRTQFGYVPNAGMSGGYSAYKSMLNPDSGRSAYFSPGSPDNSRSYSMLNHSPTLKSVFKQSPEQIRAMNGAYAVPSGIYANTNNRQSYKYDIPHAVAQNVARNLNYPPQANGRMQMSRHKTDLNGNKTSRVQKLQKSSRANNSNKNAPIVIDDDDDDDVCFISSSESDAITGPPSKKRKVEKETSLLFKCHLCGEELTCSGSFASYIEKHFADRHNVRTIQLIEHIDQNGQKVVSIVEKQAIPQIDVTKSASKSGAQKTAKSPMTPQNGRLNPPRQSSRNRSISPKAKVKQTAQEVPTPKNRSANRPQRNSDSAKRRSNRNNVDSSPVICIDID